MSGEGPARRRRAEGPGWLVTAAGACVLVVVGFALGLVAGAAFEEPALVADHLAGRTTEVTLREGGPGAADPASGAEAVPDGDAVSRPAPEAPRRPLGAPRAEPGAPEAPAVAAAPPAAEPEASPDREAARQPGEGFAVQVGAFSERAPADALATELRSADLSAYVAEEAGGAPWKVRVGPVADRGRAEALATRLKTERSLPTWILSRGAR